MKKMISIMRFTMLLIMAATATVLLCGEEKGDSMAEFIMHLVIDKSLAILIFSLTVTLYRRWRKSDVLIRYCSKRCVTYEV